MMSPTHYIKCLAAMFFLASMMISLAKPNSAPSFSLTGQPVKLKLPSVFSDHMVLQQKTSAPIWGWAEAEQKVSISVSWSRDRISVHANKAGKWLADIRTPQGGGPYEIEISTGEEVLILRDVLIGEVWLCSGQSNMVWGAAFGHQEMLEELPNTHHQTIRLLNITRNHSGIPLDTLQDAWQVCDSASAGRFSAIGYYTAKALNEKLNVPIGIISSCAGSTTVEAWTPHNVFDIDPSLTLLTNQALSVGSYWNAMMRPLAGFKIKGVFWYQGEGNVISYRGYGELVTQMVKAWRAAWGYNFTFFQVQIAPYSYNSQGVLGNKAAFLREQQVNSLFTISKSGLVVTTDLVPDINEIHPPKKKEIAIRLGDLALAEVYGSPMVDYRSPIYERCQIKDKKLIVHFRFLKNGLYIHGDSVTDIFIAGEDRIFYPAAATVEGNTLEVFSARVSKPLAVRFGFTDTACPNLFNTNGLPVSPFRTDDWDIP